MKLIERSRDNAELNSPVLVMGHKSSGLGLLSLFARVTVLT